MAKTTNTHRDYSELEPEFKKTRDAIEGEPAIKSRRTEYLPHPSQVDPDSNENQIRYAEYLAGADYENSPDKTRRSLLGKMRIDDAEVTVPDSLEGMIDDVDGDGKPLHGAIERSVSEAILLKFQMLLVDYDGLTDLADTEISIAELESINPRPKIVQYSRDDIINWHFDVVNGQRQLMYIKLKQHVQRFEPDSGGHTDVESYLVLALDQDGEYYQQKEVEGKFSDPNYVTVGGQRLKYLPVFFVSDEQMPSDRLPRQLGFIYPIVSKALKIYVKTAQLDEHQRALCPTASTTGWTMAKWDQFKEINDRSYIARGGFAINNYPEGVSTKVDAPDGSLDSYFKKIDSLKKDIKFLGGEVDSEVEMTATEALIAASAQTAFLHSLASNAEDAWTAALRMAAVMEGVDDSEISVKLPRKFDQPRLSREEVQTMASLVAEGIYSQAELMRQLKAGGWMIDDIETVMGEIENQPSGLSLPEFLGEQSGGA